MTNNRFTKLQLSDDQEESSADDEIGAQITMTDIQMSNLPDHEKEASQMFRRKSNPLEKANLKRQKSQNLQRMRTIKSSQTFTSEDLTNEGQVNYTKPHSAQKNKVAPSPNPQPTLKP